MSVKTTETRIKNVLTRTTGYLKNVSSHSLQPYRGCTFGRSLCGVGCYVQHNQFLTRGAPWGSFLEARTNAAEAYRAQHSREQRWAQRLRGRFSIFMSSSTDPFVPQERRFRISQDVLTAMCELPPDELVLQTHTHLVTDYLDLYRELARRCALRIHLSIESDLERLPYLPAPASSVDRRFEAAQTLKRAGLQVVITVAPLFPIRDPHAFFQRIADVADSCVIDHFIGGDGSPGGARTARTALPTSMQAVDPDSTGPAYRDRMVQLAHQVMPGRVGVSIDGFAGRRLPAV
jgi:DNA repair photolyase